MGLSAARFRIAGLSVEVQAPEPVIAGLRKDFAAFATGSSADWVIEASVVAGEPPAGPRTLPEIEPSPEGVVLRGDCYSAQVHTAHRRASVKQCAERFPIEAVLKVLLARELSADGGLLVHGVGIAKRERAALFLGPSGAGKSTLGRLCASAGLTVLSDELVAVRPEAEEYLLEGTPWYLGLPRRCRLQSVGLLAWSDRHRLEAVSPTDLFRDLSANTLIGDPTASGRARLFRAASDLLNRVPSVRLHFAKETSVAEVIGSALEPR